MDLSLDEQQRQLQDVARDFVRREASRDALVAMDREGRSFDRELWQKAASLGWLGVSIPPEYGGEGMSLLDAAVIYEELGRGPVPGPFFESAILCAQIILAGGTEEQKRALLPAIASGERIFSLAAMDPSPRWGPRYVRMEATPSNGGFRLNGVKPFVQYATASDSYLVAARTSAPEARTEQGITLFVVDRDTVGVRVRDLEGRPLEGLLPGLGEVTMENVQVPASAVLGQVGEGWHYVERAAIQAIPVLCSYQVGGMEALTELAIEYSRSRVVFGQPIGRFQRVQDRIIDAVNCRDAARWINYETIWLLEAGRPAEANVHMAKAVASEGYYVASDLTAAVFGGIGVEPGTGVNKHIKMSRRLYSLLGDPIYHRGRMVDALEV